MTFKLQDMAPSTSIKNKVLMLHPDSREDFRQETVTEVEKRDWKKNPETGEI